MDSLHSAILDHSQSLVAAFGPDLSLLTANKAYTHALEALHGQASLPGQTGPQCLPTPNQPYWEERLRSGLQGQSVHDEYHETLPGHAKPTHVKYRIEPLIQSDLIVGVVLYLSDITRQREAEKEAEELDMARESMRQVVIQAYTQIELQQRELERKNKALSRSINYAARIQRAMLPPADTLQGLFPQSFIYFQPRDVVSGDFYWFAQKQTATTPANGLSLVAVADCTGHGIPGAFLSLVGIEQFNKLVNLLGITSPGLLLQELHRALHTDLTQESAEMREGMDLGLCTYDATSQTLTFAGAKSELIYIQDGQMHRLKGDRLPVGGYQIRGERRYQEHTLHIDRPTWCYLFSDGYQDQFGGPKNRKFLKRAFRQLLTDICPLTAERQQHKLHEVLTKWKGEQLQIDDILVVGFCVG